MKKLLDSGVFSALDDIQGALLYANKAATSLPALTDILEKVEQLDNILDSIRPAIKRLASLPLLSAFGPIRVLADALESIEEVLDSIPATAD